MYIEELFDKGYDIRQINQIIEIDKLGIDLSNINTLADPDILKKFKNKIINHEFSDYIINKFKEAVNDGFDIYHLINEDINELSLGFLCSLLCEECDLSNFNKHMDSLNIERLYFLSKSVDVSYLFGFDNDNVLKEICLSISNSCDKNSFNIKVRNILNSEMDIYSALELIKALELAEKQKKEIDVYSFLDGKFNSKQLHVIMAALLDDIDLRKYADERYDEVQLRVLHSAIKSGLDINYFNKLRYSGEQMDTICFWLSELDREEESNINLILNNKYNCVQMDLIMCCYKEDIDVSKICNDTYDFSQMYSIYKGIRLGLNVDLFKDLNLTGREMYTVINALQLQQQGYNIDINIFLDQTIPLKDKLNILIKTVYNSNIDLNYQSLDDVVSHNSRLDLNDFYFYCESIPDEYKFTLNDDNYIILNKTASELPDQIGIFDSEAHIEEIFLDLYEDEILKIIDILSFIDYTDKGFFLYNLLYDEQIYNIDVYCDILESLSLAYEEIKDNTFISLSEGYDNGSFFYTLDEIAECGGPDKKKLVIEKELFEVSDTLFIIERDINPEDIPNIKNMFEESYEKYYSYFKNDVFAYDIFNKNGDSIKNGIWYGSFDLKNRLEKELNVSIKDTINLNINNDIQK